MRVLGKDPVHHAGDLRGRMGCQLQESRLPDHLKVWEALDLFASLAPGAVDWQVLIEQWGLAEKRDASFSNLSGGQRSACSSPWRSSAAEVVFLDEMTTGLDPSARRIAWDLIEQIRDRGCTVVLVTHFMDEAERLCDRVAVVDGQDHRARHSARPGRRYDPLEQVVFTCEMPEVDWLGDVPGAQSVTRRGPRMWWRARVRCWRTSVARSWSGTSPATTCASSSPAWRTCSSS